MYLLLAININKSLTSSNAKVIEAILRELQLDTTDLFYNKIILIIRDQLLLACLKLVSVVWVENKGGVSALKALFTSIFFYYKIAGMHSILFTYLS